MLILVETVISSLKEYFSLIVETIYAMFRKNLETREERLSSSNFICTRDVNFIINRVYIRELDLPAAMGGSDQEDTINQNRLKYAQ